MLAYFLMVNVGICIRHGLSVLFVVSLVGLGSYPMTFPHNPVTSQGDAVRLVLKLPSGDRVERTFDAQEFDFFC